MLGLKFIWINIKISRTYIELRCRGIISRPLRSLPTLTPPRIPLEYPLYTSEYPFSARPAGLYSHPSFLTLGQYPQQFPLVATVIRRTSPPE
jgi:hypothetical protein